jgi:hypothetical protein
MRCLDPAEMPLWVLQRVDIVDARVRWDEAIG